MITNNPISINVEQHIGVITIDYPPVNALGQAVRQGLMTAIEELESDDHCQVIIIQCIGKTFIAGADIKEFGSPPLEPYLPDVVNRIEACQKPVVASLFGTALGGGFEVALACHYRVALSNSKVGLPEVNLGLIPGAGGTQRLMRLVGVEKALAMITSGKHMAVTEFQESGLFDAIFSIQTEQPLSDLHQMTRAYCRQLISADTITINPVGQRQVDAENFDWDAARVSIIKNARGKIAPLAAFDVLHDSWDKSISKGMAIERQQFIKLLSSEQSAALRYAFAAEKKAAKLSTTATALMVNQVGIIGGGTMGAGICTAFLSAGFAAVLIEQTEATAQIARERINSNFAANVKKQQLNLNHPQFHLDLYQPHYTNTPAQLFL